MESTLESTVEFTLESSMESTAPNSFPKTTTLCYGALEATYRLAGFETAQAYSVGSQSYASGCTLTESVTL